MQAENFSQPLALKNRGIRRACTAVEHIVGAAGILDELPTAILEQVRDYCNDYVKCRAGAFSHFKRAYIELVVDHLNEMHIRERPLLQGITGNDGRA